MSSENMMCMWRVTVYTMHTVRYHTENNENKLIRPECFLFATLSGIYSIFQGLETNCAIFFRVGV